MKYPFSPKPPPSTVLFPAMHTHIDGELLNLFREPARILFAGNSGSGKTTLVSNILRQYRSEFDEVVIIGADLPNSADLHITRNDSYNPLTDSIKGSKTLAIFDDIIFEPRTMKIAAESFVRARHLGVSLFFLSQNLYLQSKEFRVIGLNVTHVFLLRCRDTKQIYLYGKSFLQDRQVPFFVELFKRVVLKTKYSHLLIDFTADCDSPLMLRSHIASGTSERAYEL